MKQDMILILDLGSEENPRLAREIRALGVYSEIHPHDITLEEVKALPNVKGIILNGGPNRVVDGVRSTPPRRMSPSFWPTTRVISPGPAMRRNASRPSPISCSVCAAPSPIGIWRTSLPTRWS